MQTSKASKKSGFKCPSFSVPSKTKDEESLSKKKIVKSTTKSDKQGKLSTKVTAAGDNTEDSDFQVVPQNTVSEHGDNYKSTKEKSVVTKRKSEFKASKGAPENGSRDKVSTTTHKEAKKKRREENSNKTDKDKTSKHKTNLHTTANDKTDQGKPKKDKKPGLPFVSLTDEQYDELFDAVFEFAENLDIENWEPKVTPPVMEPKMRKFSITVGKKETTPKTKPDSSIEQHVKDRIEKQKKSFAAPDRQDVEEKKDRGNKDSDTGDEGDSDLDSSDSETEQSESKEQEEKGLVLEAGDDQEILPDHQEQQQQLPVPDEDEEMPAQPLDENNNRVQLENETTPAGSELDSDAEHEPRLKLKRKFKIKKSSKLEPKKLPFQEEKKVPSMPDRGKEAKKKKKSNKTTMGSSLKETRSDSASKHKTSKDLQQKQRQADSTKDEHKSKQKSTKSVSMKTKMQEREVDLIGTWVQCGNSTCIKWRYLADIHDPSQVPDRWTCSLNKNKVYNSCDKPEESYDESDHIYTQFTEGSVVWAKMIGFPWWPAMIEIDPYTETFFSIETEDCMNPTHYHVVFFDERVSRCWIKSQFVRQYSGNEQEDGITNITKKKGASHTKEINVAKKNAKRALICTLKERIELFGFACRYKGTWQAKNKKDTSKKNKPQIESLKKTKRCHDQDDNELVDLDESTMNDVIDNADDLLNNVEDLLESLGSELMDSDDDSEFAPEELIVGERKRKQKDQTACCRTNAKSKRQKLSTAESSPIRPSRKSAALVDTDDDDSDDDEIKTDGCDMEIAQGAEIDDNTQDGESVNGYPAIKSAAEDCSESETEERSNGATETKKTANSIPITKLNLDKEIFTMEMDSDNGGDCELGEGSQVEAAESNQDEPAMETVPGQLDEAESSSTKIDDKTTKQEKRKKKTKPKKSNVEETVSDLKSFSETPKKTKKKLSKDTSEMGSDFKDKKKVNEIKPDDDEEKPKKKQKKLKTDKDTSETTNYSKDKKKVTKIESADEEKAKKKKAKKVVTETVDTIASKGRTDGNEDTASKLDCTTSEIEGGTVKKAKTKGNGKSEKTKNKTKNSKKDIAEKEAETHKEPGKSSETKSTSETVHNESSKDSSQKHDKKSKSKKLKAVEGGEKDAAKETRTSKFKAPKTSSLEESESDQTNLQTSVTKKSLSQSVVKTGATGCEDMSNKDKCSQDNHSEDGENEKDSKSATGKTKPNEESDLEEMDLFEDVDEDLNVKDNQRDETDPASHNYMSQTSDSDQIRAKPSLGETSKNAMSQSLYSDSEDEFNISEQTMYEDSTVTVSGGDDKIRERVVTPVPVLVTYSEEESDPFDLMEE